MEEEFRQRYGEGRHNFYKKHTKLPNVFLIAADVLGGIHPNKQIQVNNSYKSAKSGILIKNLEH